VGIAGEEFKGVEGATLKKEKAPGNGGKQKKRHPLWAKHPSQPKKDKEIRGVKGSPGVRVQKGPRKKTSGRSTEKREKEGGKELANEYSVPPTKSHASYQLVKEKARESPGPGDDGAREGTSPRITGRGGNKEKPSCSRLKGKKEGKNQSGFAKDARAS